MSRPRDPWKARRLGRRRDRKRLQRLRSSAVRRSKLAGRRKFAEKIAPRVFVPDLRRAVHTLTAPERINLSRDYDETARFLENVRTLARSLRSKLHVDLRTVRQITPAGALALVAEFDRWREISTGRRLKPVHLRDWQPDVRRKLLQMGFFDVLNARHDVADDEPVPGEETYLPFLSGHGSQGNLAQELRSSIERLGPKLTDRQLLYDGLVEAMTNVKQHAYSPTAKVKRWWMSASVDVNGNRLTVMFLDHGSSIPRTLPRSTVWERVRPVLELLGAEVSDDAKMIQAALSAKRSRTGQENRGRGLREDIRGFIEEHEADGRLRVLSARGRCTFNKARGEDGRFEVERLDRPFKGTFLEWRIQDYSHGE